MKEDHAFYAGIHDPRELRRDLLNCQKTILDSLKKHEQLRSVRAEKEMRMAEFRKMLSGVKLVMGRLKSTLPANMIKAKPREPEARPISAPAKKEAQQRKTKLQVLEDELSRIESKLSSLE